MAKPKRKTVYRGHVFNVEEWTVPSTGSRFSRIVGYDVVCVLPVLEDGRILLEKQYRHALDRYIYEIPAGQIDPGERPEAAGKRELEEETGYLAGKMTHLLNMYSSPGSHSQLTHVYLAEKLKKTRDSKEKDEIIEVMEVSLDKVLRMIETNKINDGKTILSILYYLRFIKK